MSKQQTVVSSTTLSDEKSVSLAKISTVVKSIIFCLTIVENCLVRPDPIRETVAQLIVMIHNIEIAGVSIVLFELDGRFGLFLVFSYLV